MHHDRFNDLLLMFNESKPTSSVVIDNVIDEFKVMKNRIINL